jgi:hypothetical protein
VSWTSTRSGSLSSRGRRAPRLPPIVAAGANATVLHIRTGTTVASSTASSSSSTPGASTITTRPTSRGRSPSAGGSRPQADRLSDRARGLRRPLCARGATGVTLETVHQAAVGGADGGPRRSGAGRGASGGRGAGGAYRPFYMHRTSHFLGLDVHDAGIYCDASGPRPARAGLGHTVEPASTFRRKPRRRPFRGIGVRIEDDVLVTSDGAEVLTSAAPSSWNRSSCLHAVTAARPGSSRSCSSARRAPRGRRRGKMVPGAPSGRGVGSRRRWLPPRSTLREPRAGGWRVRRWGARLRFNNPIVWRRPSARRRASLRRRLLRRPRRRLDRGGLSRSSTVPARVVGRGGGRVRPARLVPGYLAVMRPDAVGT